MHTITATFEVVTPMFLGGADNKKSAELRASSIKGQLRFWWRALAWGRIENLDRIHEAEARIFGSADSGRGCFLLQITEQKLQRQSSGILTYGMPGKTVMPGARYLGYGLMTAFGRDAGKLERPCIREGGTFTVRVLFSRPPKHKDEQRAEQLAQQNLEDRESVLQALKLFGLLGGLGSRIRRGWGSVSLTKMFSDSEDAVLFEAPDSECAFRDALTNVVGTNSEAEFPVFTAFSKHTRVTIAKPSGKLLRRLNEIVPETFSLEALAFIGSAMVLFRSWGRGGRVQLIDDRDGNGRTITTNSDKNFETDHQWYDWFHPQRSGNPPAPGYHPRRVIFGLPHNYRDVSVTGTERDRRASPLMIHLHRLGNGEIIAVLGTFPCLFLPALSPQTESERKTFAQGNAVLRKKQQRHKDNSTVTQFSVKLNETISLEKYEDIEPRVGLPDWQILFDFMNCSHLQQANENTIFAGKAP